jgi:hypothetical protein
MTETKRTAPGERVKERAPALAEMDVQGGSIRKVKAID